MLVGRRTEFIYYELFNDMSFAIDSVAVAKIVPSPRAWSPLLAHRIPWPRFYFDLKIVTIRTTC